MQHIDFTNAYYLKMGRRGKWEKSSIEEGKARIGWPDQSLDDINDCRWDRLATDLANRSFKNKGAATRNLKQLKTFTESTSEDVWITFYDNCLWWCRLEGPIQSDSVSKYRETAKGWSNQDTDGNLLLVNQLSGKIAKIQAFRATICRVRPVGTLKRILNHEPSDEYHAIVTAKDTLAAQVERGLKQLHWQDFETLVDLLFSSTGWRRFSLVGKTMKYADIEYEEPITKNLYQVQVKSKAGLAEYRDYAARFSADAYKKLYFVVHSPTDNLCAIESDENVPLILPAQLAQMVVNLGYIEWLLNKIR